MIMTGVPGAGLSFVQLFVAIFSGTFGLMGLIFLGVGAGFIAAQNKKRVQCTAYAEGTVSAVQGVYGSNGLRAAYSFVVDGKQVQYVSSYSSTGGMLIGQTVQVYYDPSNISRVYIEEEARQVRRMTRVFTILGAVFTVIAVFVAVILLGVL